MGKLVFIFAFLVLLFASSLSRKVPVGIFNENDEQVGIKWADVSENYASDLLHHVAKLNQYSNSTPAIIRDLAKELFTGKIKILNDLVVWQKEEDLCPNHDFKDVALLQDIRDCTPLDLHNPCELTAGYYTWALTDDFNIGFARYVNTWEWGTKHKCIATPTRSVFASGEMHVLQPGEFEWNLSSGTYVKVIRDRAEEIEWDGYDDLLISNMDKIFTAISTRNNTMCVKRASPTSNIKKFKETIFPQNLPTVEFIDELCGEPDVQEPLVVDGTDQWRINEYSKKGHIKKHGNVCQLPGGPRSDC